MQNTQKIRGGKIYKNIQIKKLKLYKEDKKCLKKK